jgi:hypothetical protein
MGRPIVKGCYKVFALLYSPSMYCNDDKYGQGDATVTVSNQPQSDIVRSDSKITPAPLLLPAYRVTISQRLAS